LGCIISFDDKVDASSKIRIFIRTGEAVNHIFDLSIQQKHYRTLPSPLLANAGEFFMLREADERILSAQNT
jgi:hypothetical protein